jgi:hypothetical protein
MNVKRRAFILTSVGYRIGPKVGLKHYPEIAIEPLNGEPVGFGSCEFVRGLVAGARNRRYLQLWSGAA